MRKRRVVIFDDDPITISMMRYFFALREGYEILAYEEPRISAVWYDEASCANQRPCADIMLSDPDPKGINGLELYKAQAARGCHVPMKNKAILARRVSPVHGEDILRLGCAFFEKPFDFHKISQWLDVREPQMDLTQALGIRRKEDRLASDEEVIFMVPPFNNVLKGVAVNVSPSGLCMRTMVPLMYDQTVTIHPSFYPNPSRAASVRWDMKMQGGYYLSGLQYL